MTLKFQLAEDPLLWRDFKVKLTNDNSASFLLIKRSRFSDIHLNIENVRV